MCGFFGRGKGDYPIGTGNSPCARVCVHVCVCVRACVCVSAAISINNFVKCWPIVTKLYMKIAGYDICIVKKYQGLGQRTISMSLKL